ncbi:hypothetical protein Tco_1539515 [Tanacetum coccineum]
MVVEGEVLNDFPRFVGVFIAEFAAGSAVNLALKMKGDMIIKNLDLKPTIDAIMRNFLEAAQIWLEKEPPRSILTWEDLAWDHFKDLLHACPHYGFTELHQLDTFYNALTPTDQDYLNAAADVSTNAPSSSTPHFPEIAALADAVKAMLAQKYSPPASVKAVEEICVTYTKALCYKKYNISFEI